MNNIDRTSKTVSLADLDLQGYSLSERVHGIALIQDPVRADILRFIAADYQRLLGEAEVADEQLAQLRGFSEAHKTCIGSDEKNPPTITSCPTCGGHYFPEIGGKPCPSPEEPTRLQSPQGECPTGDYEQAEVEEPQGNRSESPAPIYKSEWRDQDLWWSINGEWIGDKDLRNWCYWNMGDDPWRYVGDTIRQCHINAYANHLRAKGEKAT